jgi:ketosteroid isomerase-like protein
MPTDAGTEKNAGTALQPEQCDRILLAALEAGDIETCVALYEPTAVIFKKSGETVTGPDAIRQANAALIALNARYEIEFIKSAISADGSIGTNRMKAKMTWTDAGGKLHESTFHSLEVVRRQADGSWRFVIDDPYGSMRDSLEKR